MYIAEVRVELKKGVADPEGENTKKTLGLLGFKDVTGVRSIKTFEINLNTKDKDAAQKEADEMCKRLLANPVIHNYSISIKSK